MRSNEFRKYINIVNEASGSSHSGSSHSGRSGSSGMSHSGSSHSNYGGSGVRERVGSSHSGRSGSSHSGSGVSGRNGMGSTHRITPNIDEKWNKPTVVNPEERGKYAGKSKAELLKAYHHLKDTGPHPKGSKEFGRMRELAFAIRAKGNWGKVKE